MYQTLYRKYRPKNFQNVYGQEVIVRILKNAIISGRISHANMFIGPRGTGKTSIAKIFSRAINCEKNNDGDLCGECDSCKISSAHECLDIIEIDAASNNGVDEIRELRDKVNLVPSSLKYKIYIIDEVHMLTVQAFNALLKTLEEPPEHVVFVLATTDPQKVPETIVSRCQCFNFERISENNIVSNLVNICKAENVSYELAALDEIAIFSNGGMRDAIGLLDKLISYSNDSVTLEDFYIVNNIISRKERNDFLKEIFDGNMNYIINKLEKWSSDGFNIAQLMINLLDDMKNKIVEYYINDSEIDIASYEKFSIFLNDNLEKIKKSNNQKIYVELIILKYIDNNKIINNYDALDTSKIENISREIKTEENIISQNDKIENISREIIKGENSAFQNDRVENISQEIIKNKNDVLKINSIRINNAFASADKNELNIDKQKIIKLNDYVFDQNIGYLVCSLMDSTIVVSSKKYIVLCYLYSSMLEENFNRLEKLNNVLKDIAGIDKKIALVSNDEWKELKNEYINKLKKGESYKIIDEISVDSCKTDLNFNENSDIINDVTNVFGNIVEID